LAPQVAPSGQWWRFTVANRSRGVRYYGISLLDQGGFGQVWSGFTDSEVPVALKIIKPSSDPQADLIRWFTEQSIYLQCLNHQFIVTTYDQFVSDEGYLVIVMEKAEGSLEGLLRAGRRFDPSTVCVIGTQLLCALAHVHKLGVIHRDVTLKNILWFPNGACKLADFGISKALASVEELARTLIAQKTFIPPELLYGSYSSQQSDIYQLGLVLLTLLTGAYPILPEASIEETRTMVLQGVPRQIAESLIPRHGDLARILSVMLRRRVDWRYQTVMDAWLDLFNESQRHVAA
jgi:serine/threonine-protein kinase